ncbi:MAG: adenosylcobinamide-GDP ribazoletransferase [Halanaerobiaceae bacterium]
MQALLFAITFLTRIPVPLKFKYNEELPSQSFTYFPVVGFLAGIIIVFLDKLFYFIFPEIVSNIMLLIVYTYLTGALHFDGFMDSIDGLFSGRKKKEILEIMHDSHTGSFAVIAVILLILLKLSLFLEFSTEYRVPILILMPVISRWIVVFTAYRYPLASSSQLAKGFSRSLKVKQITLSTIFLMLFVFLIAVISKMPLLYIIAGFSLTLFFNILYCRYIIRKIGGLTGDIYGAVIEISEVLFLLSTSIVLNF